MKNYKFLLYSQANSCKEQFFIKFKYIPLRIHSPDFNASRVTFAHRQRSKRHLLQHQCSAVH